MQSKCTNKQLNFQAINGRIQNFFTQFSVGSLAYRCGMKKERGVPVMALLMTIFSMPFNGCNIYQYFSEKNTEFQKDAAYSFLRSPNISWRLFLQRLALAVIAFFQSFQGENPDAVLIVDTTILERPRAKKVELCSRVYDYVKKVHTKGFRTLALGYSDGHSFLPLDFALFCAREAKNILCDAVKQINSRTSGGKRRAEAHLSTVEVLCSMLKRAKAAGVKVSHVLMDSWFATPDTMCKVSAFYPVICMAKKCANIQYVWGDSLMTLKALYRTTKKRPGKAKWLGSVFVTGQNNLELRIIFVRHKQKSKKWLALLTTDMQTSEEEIIRLYGLRWDIEVFFRTVKQHLGFSKGIQARDFDSIIANTTIVSVRYIFLSVEQRKLKDVRSLGRLFRACCQELEGVSFFESLQRLFEISLTECTEKHGEEKVIQAIFDTLVANAVVIFTHNTGKQLEHIKIAV